MGSAAKTIMNEPQLEPSKKTKVEELPIPTMLFSCMNGDCNVEASWPAEDLHWFPEAKKWICLECRNEEDHGKPGISLKHELGRRVLETANTPFALLELLRLQPHG